MNLIKDIKSVIIDIKHNKFAYAFLFIQVVYFSGLVKQFQSDYFLAANLISSLLLCIKNNKLSRRDVNFIFVVLAIFALINLIPFITWDSSPILFLGYSGRICLGILIIVYLKNDFYDKFEKIVFILALISLPLFFIQLIQVQIFDVFQGLSELVLNEKRLYSLSGQLSGHRYIFIYLVNSWGELRNSGFMWEPSAFGAMLCWAMLMNGFINSFSINLRLLVLFIAALSTFSIGTYVYLIILIVLFMSKSLGKKSTIYMLLILALVGFAYKIDFVKNNIDMIENKIEAEQIHMERIQTGQAGQRVSRVGGFTGNIKKIIDAPLGYGFVDKSVVDDFYSSPNGFMTLIEFWGLFSIIIILVCSFRLIKILNKLYSTKLNLFQSVLVFLVLILPIAGNPFYNQPFLFAIFFSGFIITPSCYKILNKHIFCIDNGAVH